MKLISQLFGDRQMIANATGCSSIYSASIPSTHYTKNEKGQDPCFNRSNLFASLVEELSVRGLLRVLCRAKRPKVEHGSVGSGNQKTMVSTNRLKERVAKLLQEMIDGNASYEYKALAQEWIANKEDADKTKEIALKQRKCIAEGDAKFFAGYTTRCFLLYHPKFPQP